MKYVVCCPSLASPLLKGGQVGQAAPTVKGMSQCLHQWVANSLSQHGWLLKGVPVCFRGVGCPVMCGGGSVVCCPILVAPLSKGEQVGH